MLREIEAHRSRRRRSESIRMLQLLEVAYLIATSISKRMVGVGQELI
jgi:hypothetical protein